MEYGKIIAVTGLPGLFELLNSKNDGAIVRSLEDNTTKFVSSRVHNFSHLESIEVFTVRDNVNLVEIFHAMEKESGNIPDGKDTAELKKYFQKVYSDLDFERVYVSDLKKMAKWFNILKQNNIEIKLTEQTVEEAEEATEEKTTPTEKAIAEDSKPAATEKKKATAVKAGTEEEAKAPAKKKASPKEKASGEEKAPVKKTATKEKTTAAAKSSTDKEKAAPKKK